MDSPITREVLNKVLTDSKWRVPVAAEIFGLTRTSIYKHMRNYGLTRPPQFSRKNLNREKTHCKRGHEYNEENTALNTAGHRVCRPCMNMLKRTTKLAKYV